MDLSSISLQQLRYLDAVAGGRTFGEAADVLFVSQSALSQGLARLDELSGHSVFEVDGRRRRLTDAGREIAASARRILAEADRLGHDLDRRAAGEGGRLRLSMIDAAALYLFPAAVPSFRSSHTGVEVVVTVRGSDDCLARLDSFQDDVAIVVGPAQGFDTIPLASERFSLYGPDERPPPDAAWMLYPAGSHTRGLIDVGMAELGIQPTVVGESGNPAVLRQLAILNRAWTVLPAAVAGAERLVRGADVMDRPIVAARRTTAPPTPVVEEFLRLLDRAPRQPSRLLDR